MELKNINFLSTNLFSEQFNEYVSKDHVSIDKIHDASERVSLSSDKRAVLSQVLTDQYKGLQEISEVRKNIDALNHENAFTVTTGHQLNIFTGPLYVIYKIVSTIKLSQELNNKFPEKKFVPVYWMASEDHDFEEIKSFHAFGKDYSWDINPSGSVGKIDPTSLKGILEMLPENIPFFEDAYLKSNTLSEAVRKYMHFLFGSYGLIVLDASSKRLKSGFTNIIKDDILKNTIHGISSSDKKSQVHVRKINFFYMKDNLRERIVFEGNSYKVNNSDISFKEEEITKEIDENPQYFSPNVISRCLYQESILPNVSYLGGPAEVVYWLEFKKFFDAYDINFPVVMPRDFVLLLTKRNQKILDKYGIDFSHLFEEKKNVIEKVLDINTNKENNFDDEIKSIKDIYDSLVQKYAKIDRSMSGNILSRSKKTIKEISELEKRFKKAQKLSNAKLIENVDGLYHSLFADGSSQERYTNFLNFYVSDKMFIESLMKNLNPLDLTYKVIKL
jgi:bacillithiol biosynthesis cysteine-adding enzyme BshC